MGVAWRRDSEMGVVHEEDVSHVCWHERGDYFASITAGQGTRLYREPVSLVITYVCVFV